MPPKAAYLTFEDDPSEEFDFFLARELRMTVADMRERMSMDEYTRWYVYYGRKSQREELSRKRAQ
jgi:hypothetical protein